MEERKGVIYCITNLLDGKRYIGQTIQKPYVRWKEHQRSAIRGTDLAVHRAIRKYGADQFAFSVLLTCSASILDGLEALFISDCGTLSPGGYNLTAGGYAGCGPLTPYKRRRRKEKLRAAALRQWSNPDTRATMLKALDGKPGPSAEVRKRIAAKLRKTYRQRPELIVDMVARNTGLKASEAKRAKMRESQQRRRKREATADA